MATSGTLSIKLRCASWQQLASIYQRDLIRGTMFLRSASPPPLGTVIRISMTLPSGSMIEMTGVVERQVTDQRGTGVELQLAPLADGAVWMIESALEAEQRRGTHASPSQGVAVAPPVAAVVAAPPPPVASMGDGAEVTSAETDLVRALLAEVDAMKKLNPFLVLGIGYEASDVEVRRAFGELTKRYHPDRFARYESSELRHVAAEIFILIRDAYRRICDEEARTQALTVLGRPRGAALIGRAGGPPRPDGRKPAASPAQGQAAVPAAPAGLASEPTEQLPVHLQPPVPLPRAAQAWPEPAEVLALEALIDAGRLDEALAGYKGLAKRHPQDRTLRAGAELCAGLLALGLRDRAGAAQRFEAALEIDPSNERAARVLADMRRQATNERRGLLSRLMGKPEAREG